VSYWRGFFWTRKSEEHFESIIEEQANPTFFEKEPEGIEPGIVVRNLVKVFKGFRGLLHKKRQFLFFYLTC